MRRSMMRMDRDLAASGLRCAGLRVAYGRKSVFDGLDMTLGEGVHALQGPNGIGKSTILRVLAGAQKPDAGQVWIDGYDLVRAARQAKARLSYVADESAVYPFMSGQDLLDFCAWAKGCAIDRAVGDMVEAFGLGRHLATRFDAMSLGTRKKTMLCAAFIGAPRVLLLDEPGNGLDSESLSHLVTVLTCRSTESVVLMSSHDGAFLQSVKASPIVMQDLIEPA